MSGLIGGISWNSTLEYYRLINELVAEKLSSLYSARLILYSLDIDGIERVPVLLGLLDKTLSIPKIGTNPL